MGSEGANVIDRSPPRSASAAGEAASRLKPLLGKAGELLFVLPAFLLVGTLLLVPIGIGFVHSLYNWNPGYSSAFVGLKNFKTLARDATFQQILRNEGVFLIGVPIWVMLALGLALFLHERVRFAGLVRTLVFYPAVASPAILGILFRSVLAPDGLLDSLLRGIGLGGLAKNWLADPHLVKPVIIGCIAWATTGVGLVIFSAALSGLDPSLLEAADVEGATAWQRLRFVVLPALRPVVDLYIALMVLTVFVGLFGWIYVLTSGGPGFSSTTLDYDIYQRGLTYGQFGIAAAESVYLFFIVVLVVFLARAMRRIGNYGS